MKRYLAMFAAAAGATILSACGPAAPEMNAPADIAAIAAVRTAYIKAFNAGDAAGIAALYTADGQSQTNHQPVAKGHDAILAANKGFFDMMNAHIEVTPENTMSNGTYGMDRGSFKITLMPKAGGPAMPDEGHYLVLMLKGADGAWKVTLDEHLLSALREWLLPENVGIVWEPPPPTMPASSVPC